MFHCRNSYGCPWLSINTIRRLPLESDTKGSEAGSVERSKRKFSGASGAVEFSFLGKFGGGDYVVDTNMAGPPAWSLPGCSCAFR